MAVLPQWVNISHAENASWPYAPIEEIKDNLAPPAGYRVVNRLPASTKRIEALYAEVRRKEQLSERYYNFANSINNSYLGTAYGAIDVSKHGCYVLGQLLNLTDEVKHLQVTYKNDFKTKTDENAEYLRVASVSISNFAISVNNHTAMSHHERVLEWNINCSGQYDIANVFINQTGIQTSYSLRNDGNVLHVLGDIGDDFSNRLIHMLEENPSVTTVALGSRGGLISEAMNAGFYIRAKGLDTVLWENCHLACSLVFISGVKRTIWSPHPSLEFQQLSFNGSVIPRTHPIYAMITAYSMAMTANSSYVIDNIWLAEPNEMNIIQGYEGELCQNNVATWVQYGCISDTH